MVNNPRNDVSVDRNAVLQAQHAGLIDYSRFEKVIEQMRFQKGIAITMGKEIIVSKKDIPGAKAGPAFHPAFTNVCMKQKGQWQQIARHASIICP